MASKSALVESLFREPPRPSEEERRRRLYARAVKLSRALGEPDPDPADFDAWIAEVGGLRAARRALALRAVERFTPP
ncbi:MAG: hypothetical protein QXQ87_09455 [Halobacteria archaeon]